MKFLANGGWVSSTVGSVRIRLKDVATLAGVSEATVSRVMNRKDGVAPSTKADVLRVLAELGYEPPGLHDVPRVGSVGLIVPELGNPVFPALAQALEARLLANGYLSILCCASRATATEDDYVDTLVRQSASGMIIVSGRHSDIGGDQGIYRDLAERGVPLVLINGVVAGLEIPAVSTDDRNASIAAYEHLAALGHDRIGLLIGPLCHVPVLRKIEGFRSAAAAAGVGADVAERRISESMYSVEGGSVGAQSLLDSGVTGIIAASDMMALGAIRAVRERRLEVPDDISVVGYDDTDLMRYTDPPLTTVRQPVQQIADLASALLIAQIGGQRVEQHEFLVRAELIGRSSTAGLTVAAPL
jgi:LacI family repressor for deo operon, udp, cdd, tsx, nupC, and nupG